MRHMRGVSPPTLHGGRLALGPSTSRMMTSEWHQEESRKSRTMGAEVVCTEKDKRKEGKRDDEEAYERELRRGFEIGGTGEKATRVRLVEAQQHSI